MTVLRARRLLPFLVLSALAAGGCVSPAAPPPPALDLPEAPTRVVRRPGTVFPLSTPPEPTPLTSAAAAAAGPSLLGDKRLLIDLPNALAIAGARSVEVRFAEAKLEEARQAVYAAELSFLPWASPGIVVRSHRDNLQNTTGQFLEVTKQSQLGGASAGITWQPGTAIFKALAASRRSDAAEAASETARSANLLAVAEGYYELVRARALVKIGAQAVEEARELVHDQEARERRGVGLRADVLRAQAELAEKELERTQADAEVAVASARLAQVLELSPGAELVPTEDSPLPVQLVSSDVTLEALLSRAEAARPELRESAYLIEAAKREHEGLKWGPLVPQVEAGLTTGMLGAELGNSKESNDFGASVGWRIGPGGLLDIPAMNGAAARVRQATIRDEGVRLAIAREVVEARARALAADREVSSARNGVVAAQESLRLSKQKFQKGAGIVLEVLDAERALIRAESQEVEAIVHFDRAEYRLLRAIGEPISAARPPG